MPGRQPTQQRAGPTSPAELLRARGKLGPYDQQPAAEPDQPAAAVASKAKPRRKTQGR